MKQPMIHQGAPGVKMGVARYYVGIDPDIEKSGLVLVDKQENRITHAEALDISGLVGFLRMLVQEHSADLGQVVVVLEDSDESRNWHTDCYFKEMAQSRFNPFVCKKVLGKAAAVGRNTGLCHATSRHIRTFAEGMGLFVLGQKPFQKYWRGKDGKITQAEAEAFMTGLPKRCNQEVRDAALLAWVVSGLPIRIKPTR